MHEIAVCAWQQQVLTTLAVIWRWRHHIVDGRLAWSCDQARLCHQAAMRSSLRSLIDRFPRGPWLQDPRRAVLHALDERVGTESSPSFFTEPGSRFVLFFDGGSRGNPGPGGAGAVILATDADAVTARIVWSASMSYASCTTTNNQAEYLGLITGLATAETHRWRLDVVGDSALILGQMRSYRPPRHPTLRPLYAEARRLADRVRVRTWTHHLRAYNKMADLAANIAMDTRRSVQGLHIQPREHHSRLEAHLATDFHEWQSRHLRHDSSGPHVQSKEDLECVAKPAILRDDGDQRPMTKLESTVLYKILAKLLDVAKLPQFLLETHTSAERDVLEDFHRDHLGWLLYLLLPPGIKLSESNPKYSLLQLLLLSCGDDPAAKAVIEQLCLDVWSIRCEAKSGIAVFRFVRREVRDSWAGKTLKLGRSSVTLRATDSLSSAVPRLGKDEASRDLLYHVYLRGHTTLKHADLRAIVATVAQTIAYHVEVIESVGVKDQTGPRWKVSFNQITCPKAFEKVRRIHANLNGEELEFEVHHPRASSRTPCTKCLSVRHLTTECKNTRITESLARHTRKVVVTTGPGLPKLTAISAPKHMETQLGNLRHIAAPALEARLKEEEAERDADLRRQAKRAAEAAAREAAAEARLQQAAKDHVAQDARRRERERARAARQKVTTQLRELHKRMRELYLQQKTAAQAQQAAPSEQASVNGGEDGETASLSLPAQMKQTADASSRQPPATPVEETGPTAHHAQVLATPAEMAPSETSRAPPIGLEEDNGLVNASDQAPSFELLTGPKTPKRPAKRSAPASPPRVDGTVHMKKWQLLGTDQEGFVNLPAHPETNQDEVTRADA